MKTLISLFITLLPFGLAGQELTVATFNCEFLNTKKIHVKYGHSFYLSSSERNVWTDTHRQDKLQEASRAVAEVVARIDADMIVLTEVGDSSDVQLLLNEIEAEGTSYPHYAVGISTDYATGQHVAILSKIPFGSVSGTIPGRESFWEEPDDPETHEDTGISKGMSVSFTFAGRTIRLYGVHFSSESGGYEQDQQRIAQASIVRRNFLPHLNNGEIIIVAGDLNDRRGQPAINRIRGLDDIYGDLIQTGLARYFEEDEWDTRWTYQYEGIYQQIDHILISYNAKEVLHRSKGIQASTLDHGNELASDHRPFIVRFQF